MTKLRLLSIALAALLLLSASCAGSIRALQGEGAAALPDTVAIATTPARLVAGTTATFTAVADVSRPHTDAVVYRWDLDGLGTKSGSHADDILVGTEGTDRQIEVTLADLPTGQSSRIYDCALTIELTENGVVTSHVYPFTVTVFSS
jgi:hypothetical protein